MRNTILLFLFIFYVCQVSHIYSYEGKVVKYDGYIESGARYAYNETYYEIFSRAKLEFEIEITEQIEGEISFEANTNEREVELKDVHALFKYTPHGRIKVGNIKKRFGLEELVSEEDLYTIEKSLLNEHISEFGYVGREPSIQFYNKEKSYLVGISYNQSHTVIGIARLILGAGFYKIGLDTQYQRHTRWWFKDIEEEYLPNNYAMSLDLSPAYKNMSGRYRDLEVFIGLDPIETQYRGEDVFFLGIKSLFAYRPHKIMGGRIEPLFLFTLLFPDCEYLDFNKVETLVGVNVYFHPKVRFRINADMILSTNKYGISNSFDTITIFGRTVEGSKGALGLQVRW